MANLIIRPATGAGNKVVVQDQAGAAVLTTADSGATIASATLNSPTLVTPALGTPASGVVTNLSGVLPVGVTGGSGLTALASNPTVTLGSNATFPAGHVVQTKIGSRTSAVTFASTGYGSGGIPVTITPAYSNSKMLIQIYGKTAMNNSSSNTGHDHIVTRTAGATESNSSTTVFSASWMNYLNGSHYQADYYPPMCVLFVDSGFPNEQITYGMFGRKYGGGSSSPSWSFADYNGPAGAGYWGCMIVQEIKQ